ncbi:MAG: hypothetical protein QNJ48_14070 [Desulfobacterales bacterium]|nr:hypothetical protein [Desulfobacterales bacterium]
MKKIILLLGLMVLWPLAATAQERPSADDVRRVVDYYYRGQGQGVVLAQHFLCSEVSTEGADKNECRLKHDLPVVNLASEVMLWMNFLVPSGDQGDLLLLFSRQGRVRHTATITVKGAIRFRTWKKIPTDKAGDWTVTILQELGDTDLELASFSYQVE